MPDDSNFPDRTYPITNQHFEVVLMRNGVSEQAATQDDFRRVAIVAKDQIAAMTDEAVMVACGTEFRPVIATPPGVVTGIEQLALRRSMDSEGSRQRTDW